MRQLVDSGVPAAGVAVARAGSAVANRPGCPRSRRASRRWTGTGRRPRSPGGRRAEQRRAAWSSWACAGVLVLVQQHDRGTGARSAPPTSGPVRASRAASAIWSPKSIARASLLGVARSGRPGGSERDAGAAAASSSLARPPRTARRPRAASGAARRRPAPGRRSSVQRRSSSGSTQVLGQLAGQVEHPSVTVDSALVSVRDVAGRTCGPPLRRAASVSPRRAAGRRLDAEPQGVLVDQPAGVARGRWRRSVRRQRGVAGRAVAPRRAAARAGPGSACAARRRPCVVNVRPSTWSGRTCPLATSQTRGRPSSRSCRSRRRRRRRAGAAGRSITAACSGSAAAAATPPRALGDQPARSAPRTTAPGRPVGPRRGSERPGLAQWRQGRVPGSGGTRPAPSAPAVPRAGPQLPRPSPGRILAQRQLVLGPGRARRSCRG